jgi:uncharacterized protein
LLRFEWDPEKAKGNLRKHAVGFQEATSVFFDSLSATFDDPDHGVGEHRFITVGMSSRGRLLVVSHVERGSTLRILGARLASASERKRHEDEGSSRQ